MLDLHGYGPSILGGAIITLELAFLSLFIAILLGLLGAVAKLSSVRSLRYAATTYTTVIRGIPDLVLMMLLYFGGQVMVNRLSDYLFQYYDIEWFINFDPFVSGVLTIGFIFGAYMAETFRGAFLAVDRGQIEAGRAYGMSNWQLFSRVMFPQMLRHALPGLGNNWQVLLKTTALASVIGLSDMVRLASEAAKAVHAPFRFFIPVALIYLALTAVSELLIKYLEKRYSHGVHAESNHA